MMCFWRNKKKRLPAAKWRGVDFRPAVSLAFTVCELINFFTLIISPVLHASNNSRSGSTMSKFTDKVRLRLDIFRCNFLSTYIDCNQFRLFCFYSLSRPLQIFIISKIDKLRGSVARTNKTKPNQNKSQLCAVHCIFDSSTFVWRHFFWTISQRFTVEKKSQQ